MNSPPPVTFSPQLVAQVGEIGKVLGEFLERQTASIQQELEKRFPGVSSTAVKKILNAFVTLEGTKRPLSKQELKLPGVEQGTVDFCLDRLERSRILRLEDGLYELAHDTLALRIAEDRSAEEVAFLEITKLVRDRFTVYPTTQTLLNANELHLVQLNREKMLERGSFSPEEWAFIEQSKKENRRKRFLLGAALLGIIAVLMAFSIFSYRQSVIAKENQQQAMIAQEEAVKNLEKLEQEQAQKEEAKYSEHLALGKNYMSQSNYQEAIQEFNIALDFKEDGAEALALRAECEAKFGIKSSFERLIDQGDALQAQGSDQFVNAMEKYQTALRLNYNDNLARSKINALNGKLEGAFEAFKNKGDAFFKAKGYDLALEFYRKAQRIKPGDREVRQKIEACEKAL